jgi:hypothetical protein
MVPEIKSHSLIGGEGEESFDITICTPKSLAQECAANGFGLGRHRLVLSTYDPSLIMTALRKLVTSCTGPSWAEIGSKIARIAYWEFEDYQDALS